MDGKEKGQHVTGKGIRLLHRGEQCTANQEGLLEERLNRIRRAASLQEPDRVPVVLEYSGFAAHVTGTSMADFLSSPRKNVETMIQAYHLIGDADAVNYGSFWPYGLCYVFMCKVKVPGVDLPDDYVWQMDEKELMTVEDYDRILEMGWPSFFKTFMKARVLDQVPLEWLPPVRESVDTKEAWAANGVPVLSGGDVTTPIELLCGSRSLPQFSRDLFNFPEKVETVMNAMVTYLSASPIRRAKKYGYPAVWVGGWRSAPAMLSRPMWSIFCAYLWRSQYAVESRPVPIDLWGVESVKKSSLYSVWTLIFST